MRSCSAQNLQSSLANKGCYKIVVGGVTQIMSITIHPMLEATLRARAEAEGITVETYLERLVRADQAAVEELETLATEGLDSGDPISVAPGYWEQKHKRLDERLRNTKK